MKELKDLTAEEFYKLRDIGLLKSIYPDAPEEYADVKGKRPKPLSSPDLTELMNNTEWYFDSLEDPDGKRFKDAKHYIFEEAVKCIYGVESEVWDWINSHNE